MQENNALGKHRTFRCSNMFVYVISRGHVLIRLFVRHIATFLDCGIFKSDFRGTSDDYILHMYCIINKYAENI